MREGGLVVASHVLGGTTCVVTGGLGFIGSNLVHRLVAEGARVRIIDVLEPTHGGDRANVDGLDVDVIIADIGQPVVADVLEGADLVFNLAGQVSHTASMVDPEADLFFNTTTHVRFLEHLRRVRPTARVVHASTRQVYGRALRLPVDEEHPARPVDVNGVAKLAGEQLHLVYAHAYGMPMTSLRLTNVYGPRQRLTSNELGFLPVFVRTALQGGTIELFGTGDQRRDCLYVDDVVDALITAASVDAAVGQVFNIGHPTTWPLAEIAEVLVDLAANGASTTTRPWPDDHQRIDIGSFETDTHLASSVLGWTAHTDIRSGLAATLAFYREHPWYLSST
ncbi:MAG: NAD-dependent epimerase/dehydratase family protein [Ilumatobacteraceae bacterium]